MTVYVDADACPVRSEIEATITRHRVPAVMVCNGGIRPSANPLVQLKIVAAGLDQADAWIAGVCGPGDVVVTADIPLADLCIKAGAAVVTPRGDVLGAETIGPVLAARNLMAELRGADPFLTGGSKPFGKADRARFRDALERALRRLARPPAAGA